MTREEYLANYKEDKLAELCEQLESERNKYKEEAVSSREYKEAFEDMDKLLKMIRKLPADDFFQLYRGMESMVDRSKYSYPTISTSGCTSISGR